MRHFTLDHLIAAAYLILTLWLIVVHPWELVEITIHGGVSGAYYLKARAERTSGPKP
jgi:hypothetical protein